MKKLSLILCLAVAPAQVLLPNPAIAAETVVHFEIGVDGMTCRGCESNIKRTLGALKGVKSVKASHKDKKVTVDFDQSLIKFGGIEKAIRDLGYTILDSKAILKDL